MDTQTNRERGRKGFLVLVRWMVMPNVSIGAQQQERFGDFWNGVLRKELTDSLSCF